MGRHRSALDCLNACNTQRSYRHGREGQVDYGSSREVKLRRRTGGETEDAGAVRRRVRRRPWQPRTGWRQRAVGTEQGLAQWEDRGSSRGKTRAGVDSGLRWGGCAVVVTLSERENTSPIRPRARPERARPRQKNGRRELAARAAHSQGGTASDCGCARGTGPRRERCSVLPCMHVCRRVLRSRRHGQRPARARELDSLASHTVPYQHPRPSTTASQGPRRS